MECIIDELIFRNDFQRDNMTDNVCEIHHSTHHGHTFDRTTGSVGYLLTKTLSYRQR